jgi:hypothetical protein
MPRIRVIGDGPHDQRVLPALLRRVLDRDFEADVAEPWRLHRKPHGIGKAALDGYGAKLYGALRWVADSCQGAAAVVDADDDRSHSRLRQMARARDALRIEAPNFRVALGEAIPHGEAWLLDDEVAVRKALGLACDCPIPPVSKCHSPKAELNRLHSACPCVNDAGADIRSRIAASLDETRCNHRHDTGFAAFAEDVRRELKPLFDKPC